MANIFDTAKYILEKTGSMSTVKLQKLCYYAQAWSLVWEGKPLFDEDFEAWANGPVCVELFKRTKGKFFATVEDEYGGNDDLSDEQKETIDKVIDYYGDKSPQWLSDLTHLESPWQEARKDVPMGAPSDNIITKDSMAMYYESL